MLKDTEEIVKSDGYHVICPKCGEFSFGWDWKPYLDTEYTCKKCGHKYKGADLVEYTGSKYVIPFYIEAERELEGEPEGAP